MKEQAAPSGFFRKGEGDTSLSRKAGTAFSAFILRERHQGSLRKSLEKSSLEISYNADLEVYSLLASGELQSPLLEFKLPNFLSLPKDKEKKLLESLNKHLVDYIGDSVESMHLSSDYFPPVNNKNIEAALLEAFIKDVFIRGLISYGLSLNLSKELHSAYLKKNGAKLSKLCSESNLRASFPEDYRGNKKPALNLHLVPSKDPGEIALYYKEGITKLPYSSKDTLMSIEDNLSKNFSKSYSKRYSSALVSRLAGVVENELACHFFLLESIGWIGDLLAERHGAVSWKYEELLNDPELFAAREILEENKVKDLEGLEALRKIINTSLLATEDKISMTLINAEKDFREDTTRLAIEVANREILSIREGMGSMLVDKNSLETF